MVLALSPSKCNLLLSQVQRHSLGFMQCLFNLLPFCYYELSRVVIRFVQSSFVVVIKIIKQGNHTNGLPVDHRVFVLELLTLFMIRKLLSDHEKRSSAAAPRGHDVTITCCDYACLSHEATRLSRFGSSTTILSTK